MKTNQVTLIGFVGNDVTSKLTRNGNKVVRLRVSTSYPSGPKDGEKKWNTIWHNIVAWNSTADYAERNFVKGSRILVNGFIEYRTYSDKLGHVRYITEIKASDFINLDR